MFTLKCHDPHYLYVWLIQRNINKQVAVHSSTSTSEASDTDSLLELQFHNPRLHSPILTTVSFQ